MVRLKTVVAEFFNQKSETMPKELKVMEDKVLAAARKCPSAEDALKELFPEAFSKSVNNLKGTLSVGNYTEAVQVRSGGEYEGISFFLSEDFNWEIKRDYKNVLCLIPSRK
jgi:hypothetical protein